MNVYIGIGLITEQVGSLTFGKQPILLLKEKNLNISGLKT